METQVKNFIEVELAATRESLGQTAQRAADAAGEVLRRFFAKSLPFEDKAALSPVVTLADTSAEAAMRDVIKQAFPNDTVIGEEGGTDPGTTDRCWVLDPLDGTIAFICGKPTFVTLIGVWLDGDPVLGLIDQPILKQRWVTCADGLSQLNQQPCKTSGLELLGEAKFRVGRRQAGPRQSP